MQINLIECNSKEEEKEIIQMLKKKYSKNLYCKFREISDTFILPDKKWIIVDKNVSKILMKKFKNNKLYTSEIIKQALLKEG